MEGGSEHFAAGVTENRAFQVVAGVPRRLVAELHKHLVTLFFVKRSCLKADRFQVASVDSHRQSFRLGSLEQLAAEPPVSVGRVHPQNVDMQLAPADLAEQTADDLSVRAVAEEVQSFAWELAGVGRVVLAEPSVDEGGFFRVRGVLLNDLHGVTLPRRTGSLEFKTRPPDDGGQLAGCLSKADARPLAGAWGAYGGAAGAAAPAARDRA